MIQSFLIDDSPDTLDKSSILYSIERFSNCGSQNPLKLSDLPKQNLLGLGMTFYDIGVQLSALKTEILTHPTTRTFLRAPYQQTTDFILNLDRLWNRICSRFCQQRAPLNYGRRVLICSNSGSVFLNVQTYNADIPKLAFSYSIVEFPIHLNYQYSAPSVTPVNFQNIPESASPFNPENTNYSAVVTNSASQILESPGVLCGSPTPPPTDPSNLTPSQSTATTFAILANHLTRKEIQMVVVNPYTDSYGYASRFSDTNFATNYYVCTPIYGNDGYVVYLRLSYFRVD
jgi:hypothetical protein